MSVGGHDILWERWDEVDRLFGEALDLPADRRRPFLVAECGGDVALLDTVTTLLQSSERAEEALSGPGTGLLRAALTHGTAAGFEPTLPKADAMVGRYRIVSEIGRGGMATVYEARRADGAFDRRVALKVLRGSDAVLGGRFRTERQILSSLSHPNIARLIDGGATDDGVPWLAMELVEGEPVTDWANGMRLDVRDRLELFLQILDAVQYAHSRLVVHRDLKPSNVLVDAGGQVHLLDFGIARLLHEDDTRDAHTRPSTRWMTPEYAAPEQILGREVTTATDVHGLGVLLYELLVGQRPFDVFSRSAFELERAICDRPPPPASKAVIRSPDGSNASPGPIARERGTTVPKLVRALEGDLDAVLDKALRKVPDERYRTVSDFADDLRRHLTGFPVRAREGLKAYRARKFVGRHRLGVAVAAAFAILVLSSAVALGRLQAETARQRDAATLAAERAETEAENAQLVVDFLADVFRGRDPSQAPTDTITAQALLEWGTQRVEQEFADRPGVQAELLIALAGAHWNLGLIDESSALYERAVELAREADGSESPAVAYALFRRAENLRVQRVVEASVPLYERAIEIFRRDGAEPMLADALAGLALATASSDLDRAEALIRESLEVGSTAGDDEATMVERRLALAFVLRNADRLEEAEAVYEEAIPRYRALSDADPTTLGLNLNNLAYLKRVSGDLVGAEPLYREAHTIQVDLFGPGHPNALTVSGNLASVVHDQGRADEAIEIMRSRVVAAAAEWPEGHWRRGQASLSLANILLRAGRLTEAESPSRDAVAQYTDQLGEDHMWTSLALGNLAVLRILTDRPDEGYAFLDRLHGWIDRERMDHGGTITTSTANPLEGFVFMLRHVGLDEQADRFAALAEPLAETGAAR